MKTNPFFFFAAILAMPFIFFACSSKIDDGNSQLGNYDSSMSRPTGVAATLNTNGSITVSWPRMSYYVSEYLVFRCAMSSASVSSGGYYCSDYTQIASVPPYTPGAQSTDNISYIDNNLSRGMIYFYRVAARFGDVISPQSQEEVFAATASFAGEYGTVEHGGKTYRTVKIGDQRWMAENLNHVLSSTYEGGRKCYDNKEENCEKYGGLYTWGEAMALGSCSNKSCADQVQINHNGICPAGWHVPTSDDWDELADYVGIENTVNYLKAESGWDNYNSGYSSSPGNGENKYGFAALPGGYGDLINGFSGAGSLGRWWSADEALSNVNNAVSKYMDNRQSYWPDNYYSYTTHDKRYLFSVRCMENKDFGVYCFHDYTCNPMLKSQCDHFSGSVSYTTSAQCNEQIPKCNNTPYNPTTQYCRDGSTPANYGTVSSVDGQSYKTVIIGSQTWMAENLNYNAGSSVCPNNNLDYCEERNRLYGGLYDWATAMALPSKCNLIISTDDSDCSIGSPYHKGICPVGWHIPSQEEWITLANTVEAAFGSGTAGRHLKATNGWIIDGGGMPGTNNYGFAALPGGYIHPDYAFQEVEANGYWWNNNREVPLLDYISAANSVMKYYSNNVDQSYQDKNYLYSVRCVKDYL
jgi:uncharacterized protein (TIGR02145 family)